MHRIVSFDGILLSKNIGYSFSIWKTNRHPLMQKNELDGGNDKNEIQNQRECTKVQFVHTNLCHEAVQERYYNDSRDDAMTTLHTSDRFGVNSIDISGDYINYMMIAEHQRRLFVGNRPRRNRKKVKYGFDDLLKREQENASYDQWVGKPESRILDDGMKSRAGRTQGYEKIFLRV
eukprot:454204_1